MAVGTWLGATVVNVGTSVPVWTAIAIGAGNSLESLVATVLIRHLLGPVPALTRGEDAFTFVAIVAGSALIAASLGVLAMYASGTLATAWLQRNWLTWWLGDTTSILIAAPLLLTVHDWSVYRWTRWRQIEFAAFLLCLTGFADAIFAGPPTPWVKPYMLLPLVIFASFRFGLGGVSVVIALIAALATADTLQRHGPFVLIADSLNEALIFLQIYISVLGVVGIALAALLAQRERSEQSLRRERDALEARVADRTAALSREIEERKDAEMKVRFMAEHDFLTGLPSRTLMLDRLGQAIAAAQRHGGALALLFIDLDRFKEINDSMGHGIGDKLLQAVGVRLQQGLRSVDTVCRQGGDEFIIMLAEADTLEHVAHVASALAEAMAVPLQINGHDIQVAASIGIAMYPADAQDMNLLVKHADMAMYHAKECGGGQYKFFNSDMNRRINERLALETSLKEAIAKQEFVLEYQPEINMASGQAIGVEALVRWRHPQRGLLMPGHFIATAEDTGMIIAIGDWVLRTACQQAKAWHDNGAPVIMAVNLSVAQFRQKNLLQSVIDALEHSALAPRFLELEITESVLIDGADATLATLHALHALGVRLAIDDFGTGYSSLSYLKRFKVDKIKIDQSFVRDIGTDRDDAAIVGAIVSMARNLKLTVLAEGVETAEQFEFLAALGCDEYQGYYSSKSLSAADFALFQACR